MTLDDYNRYLAEHRGERPGNPAPIDCVALVFREGRACVCFRIPGSEQWQEVLSAPATAEEGLACAVDLRGDGYGLVTANYGISRGLS